VRLTRRVVLVAVAVLLVSAAVWPEGVERVARGALLAIGAAAIVDLVLALTRALPTSPDDPFAPERLRAAPPWVPRGMVDLDRELRFMAAPRAERRLPLAARVRETSRAAAERRLRAMGIDLEREADAAAARAVLGDAPYEFVVGLAPAAPVDELLAAIDPSSVADGEGR
jgi:hypothetical protein